MIRIEKSTYAGRSKRVLNYKPLGMKYLHLSLQKYGKKYLEYAIENLAKEEIRDAGEKPILLLPIETGGLTVARKVGENFNILHGDYYPHIICPVIRYRKRRVVIKPTVDSLKKTVDELGNLYKDDVVGIGLDDVILTGTDTMTLLNFLDTYKGEVGFKDIFIDTILDAKGFSDHCAMPFYDRKIDKYEYLKKQRKEGEMPDLKSTQIEESESRRVLIKAALMGLAGLGLLFGRGRK